MSPGSSPPVLVILNPESSSGKASRLRGRIERLLRARGVSFELEVTRGPGHATKLAASAVERNCRAIVAVGGDGTVHEVAAGMLRDTGAAPADLPSLVVVPVGTGNDFFRMIGTSSDPVEALHVLLDGERRLHDVGRARWRGGEAFFVNLLGVGVDVEVIRRRKRFRRLRGLAQYLCALLVALVRFRPYTVRIRVDGERSTEIEKRVHLAAVTVGPSVGGGFLLNPGATPDDGFLDLCFVEALTLLQVARVVPRVVKGTHGSLDVVRLRRLESARIERPDGGLFEFELDGELMTRPVPWIDLEVVPRCLPVLVRGSGENIGRPDEDMAGDVARGPS